MTLKLTHLAEPLLEAMAESLRSKFLALCGELDPTRINDDFVRTTHRIAYSDVALEKTADRQFDGASRVDLVVLINKDLAVPFEIKLGTTRLSKSAIHKRWLQDCKPSHGKNRWRGSMMAILDRRGLPGEKLQVIIPLGGKLKPVTLTTTWFVIARRSVISSWSGDKRPDFKHAGLLSFEDVVAALHPDECKRRDRFNSQVQQLLPTPDYYGLWQLAEDREPA